MQALAASPSEAWHAGWNDGYYDTYGGLRNMNIATLTSYIQGFEAGQDARTGSQQAGAASRSSSSSSGISSSSSSEQSSSHYQIGYDDGCAGRTVPFIFTHNFLM